MKPTLRQKRRAPGRFRYPMCRLRRHTYIPAARPQGIQIMIYDLAIIGGGPAGVTAAIYGARKALKTLLLTKDFFGQVGKASLVENYPGFPKITGLELMKKFKEHLKKFSLPLKEGIDVDSIRKEKNVFEIKTAKNEVFTARAVIVCAGRYPRPLKVPGETEFLGKGVSICATCDAPLFKGKTVAVVGGGNAGLQAVLELADYAKKVYILEIGPKLIADEINQERAQKNKKVEIILKAKTLEIKGKNRVESLVYQDLAGNKTKELKVDGVFIEAGYVATSDFLKGLVDFNSKGEVVIDPKTGQTRTPGLFAAGDATDTKYKQIIIAAGEGAKAALSAYEHLQT